MSTTITAPSPYEVSSGYQVEVFSTEDASISSATTMATDSAALELIQQLGLEGQKLLINPETVTRMPYRVMEAREMAVYRVMCPEVAKVEAFKAEIIPLRVLQVLVHARELGIFQRFEIWSPKSARIDDPVLVGVTQASTYPTMPEYKHLMTDTFYALARWGRALLPFDQMEAQAIKLRREKRLTALTEMSQKVQIALTVTKETNDLEYLTNDGVF